MASGGIEHRQKRADLNNMIERTMRGPDSLAVVTRKHACYRSTVLRNDGCPDLVLCLLVLLGNSLAW